MKSIALLCLLVFTATTFADTKDFRPLDTECERHLMVPKGQEDARFIFGSSTSLNLSLLRNFESIDAEVLEAFRDEVESLAQPTLRESHEAALVYAANPTEATRLHLFQALQILSPIASRHLLARLRDADELRDYLQDGYMAIWQALPNILKVPAKKLRSVFYWNGVTNGLRKTAFAAMRAHFKLAFSLTPAQMQKTSSFTFEEELLLFGDNETSRAEIARKYGRSFEDVAHELRVQNESVVINESEAVALSRETEVEDTLHEFELRAATRELLSRLPPRIERVMRSVLWEQKTFRAVSEELGLNHSRSSEIFAKGLRILQRPHHSRILKPFSDEAPTLPREYWQARYENAKREEREKAEEAERLARADADAERAEARAVIARKESAARKEMTAHLDLILSRARAISRELNRQWFVFEDGQQAAVAQIQWREIRALLKRQRARFMKVGVASELSAVAFEARLMQERTLDFAKLQGRLKSVTDAFGEIEKTLERQKQPLDEYYERVQEAYREVRTLREAHDQLKALQDGGSGMPELEASRQNLYRLLNAKEAALQSLKSEDVHTMESYLRAAMRMSAEIEKTLAD